MFKKGQLRNRTKSLREDKEQRRSGGPTIKPEETYDCMLVETTSGFSKKGNEQVVMEFKILKGETTGKEYAGKRFKIFFPFHLDWKEDALLDTLESMGANLAWIEETATDHESYVDCILKIAEAADGAKPFKIFAATGKNDPKRNNYYINEVPSDILADEDEFGVNVYQAGGEEEEEKTEKSKPKSKPKAKAKKPEPEPEPEPEEATAASDDEEWEDWD